MLTEDIGQFICNWKWKKCTNCSCIIMCSFLLTIPC